jgi:NAD(P)-dependent dehydrogenase (short-subunit alcohol dehydrogenase family)
MIEHRYGKIINISSLTARIGRPSVIPYAAAKGGIILVTMTLAKDVGAYGINVNALAPGGIVSNFPGRGPRLTTPELDERRRRAEEGAERIPIRRPTTAQDIANTVAFLVSDVSSDITGQTISVDGGLFMI